MMKKSTFLLRLAALVVMISLLVPFQGLGTVKAALPAIPPGASDRILRLKFVEGADTSDLTALLPAEAWQIIQKIDPLFTLPKTKLKEWKDTGSERLKKEKGNAGPLLPDLGQWYEIKLAPGTDMDAASALFSGLPGIETAGPAPVASDLELPLPPAVTPDYTGSQGYSGSATDGVDAQYAWTVAGGTGTGVTIYDVEYGWTQDHEDLSKAKNVALLLNPGDTSMAVSATNEKHGTAVLGEMIADLNGKGVTGIAYGANIKLAPTYTTNLGLNIGNAILLALADGAPGDVILIEQQTYVCSAGLLGPSEWNSDVYQAILTAVANGMVVVEAGGNGGSNLDAPGCSGWFDPNNHDSGAILVGAGKPPASGFDRQRESFSSYGSRVDVQGWGSGVTTTGYGSLYGFSQGLTKQYWYTATFNGTSSASPMVAASAAILQAIAIQRNGAPLSPFQIRQLLKDTGSPQLGDTATSEPIGPRPDLANAIAHLPQSAETINVNVGGSQNDGVCGITNCSLAEAIEAANADSLTSIIDLGPAATYTLTAVASSDATYGPNGLPAITSPVILRGNGATIERSSASGTPGFRLLQVSSTGSLTLSNITLRNGGLSNQPGGALLNLGTANLSGVTITGSSAANGGAIANLGTLNLTSSTLTGNSATTSGGAIQDSGTLILLGATLASNSAPAGGNLATAGTATVKNTIFVKGTNGGNCSGTLGTGSTTNLADDSSCGTGALVKTASEIGLGTLAANGGPSQTMALGSLSVAIDAGNTTGCKASKVKNIDQRGYDRFIDGLDADTVAQCDIGAYEYGSLPPAPALDEEPPMARILLTPAAPDGSNGWYRGLVTPVPDAVDDTGVIELRCVLDPAAAPASFADLPEARCPFLEGDTPVTGDGPHTLYAAALDLYDNTSPVVSASFQIDTTPPVLTCPAAGPFLLNSGDPMIGPAGVDASVSGLDETASTLSGTISTGTVGPKTLPLTAFDLAGNVAETACTYGVIYDFSGFYPPVAPAPALNLVNATSAVPMKFSLAGEQGLDILASGYPTVQTINCQTKAPLGPASATKPAGKSGLSYDALTGWYHYIWKTEKAQAGTCQVLTIQLIDGTQHIAYFQFQ